MTAGGVPAVGREGAHPSVLVATPGSSQRAGGEGQCYNPLSPVGKPLSLSPHALWEPCADVLIVTQLCHTVAGDSAHPGHPTALSQSTGVLGAGTHWVSDPMSHSSRSHRHTRSPAQGTCHSHGTWKMTKTVATEPAQLLWHREVMQESLLSCGLGHPPQHSSATSGATPALEDPESDATLRSQLCDHPTGVFVGHSGCSHHREGGCSSCLPQSSRLWRLPRHHGGCSWCLSLGPVPTYSAGVETWVHTVPGDPSPLWCSHRGWAHTPHG